MTWQKPMEFRDVAIATIEKYVYEINFLGKNKSENINKIQNSDLSEKSRQLRLRKNIYIFTTGMSNNAPQTINKQKDIMTKTEKKYTEKG